MNANLKKLIDSDTNTISVTVFFGITACGFDPFETRDAYESDGLRGFARLYDFAIPADGITSFEQALERLFEMTNSPAYPPIAEQIADMRYHNCVCPMSLSMGHVIEFNNLTASIPYQVPAAFVCEISGFGELDLDARNSDREDVIADHHFNGRRFVETK